MMGVAFPCSGSIGPATQTVWISYIADRYTMLVPLNETGTPGFINAPGTNTLATGQPQACLFANQFTPTNLTFGGFITAPDGTTNTFQKLAEDGTTNNHYIVGGIIQSNFNFWPTWRIAGIWQASDRTRIAHQIIGDISGTKTSAYCGFDLAGGQIAYGPQYTGTANTWLMSNQTIIPLGGGVYLCFVDVLCIGNGGTALGPGPSCLDFRFVLDNGSGTGSPSINYAGTAGHGVYGWKNSVLPRTAWKITGPTFFDDFNDPTMKNIDLNNTQVQGFDWYVQPGCWPGFYKANPTPANKLSVSGSILTMAPVAGGPSANGGGISTFCQPGALNVTNNGVPPGAGVGKGFRGPWLFEAMWGWDYPNSAVGGDASLWFVGVEYVNRVSNFLTVPSVIGVNNDVNYCELDPMETEATSAPYYGTTANGAVAGAVAGSGWGGADFSLIGKGSDNSSFFGMPAYNHTWWATSSVNTYPQGATVSDLGSFYVQATSTMAGTDPPNNPPWSLWTAGTGARPPQSPAFITDFTQQNLYSVLFCPYDPVTNDYGVMINFYNGACKKVSACWAPVPIGPDSSNTKVWSVDQQHYFIQMNWTGGNVPGYAMYIDMIRMSQ